ncbi:hypothetical protein I4U23_016412 [Adineta vaga]|nr:hypothetical protein I4U23_016412 [Adineta vaga]
MSTSTMLYIWQRNLFRFGGPILIFLGSISCLINLLVFTKDSLRKNPCTICFIVINTLNFICFYLVLLITTLAIGYDIDPSSQNLYFCRFRFYIAYVFASWNATCLILASIDRTIVTSSKANIRKLSTRRTILIYLFSLNFFWMIFHIHTFFYMEIQEFQSNSFICYYQPGVYTLFITYYLLLFHGFLPPLLMTIFGCLTVKNIRQVSHKIIPTNISQIGRQYILQSKDRQLIRMLFVDIISYTISKLPYAFYYLYQQITQDEKKNIEQQLIEQSILILTYFIFFIENSISGYTNILVSKTFRTEIKRIISNT